MKVSVPPELTAALESSPEARARFEKMPPSHQREYASHIAEAKKPETRARRAQAAIKRILDKPAPAEPLKKSR
ncbi:MAG: YdeI/OmpD-associated family protein [Polyangiaceae bacterium]